MDRMNRECSVSKNCTCIRTILRCSIYIYFVESKIAPPKAASVLRSLVLLMFLYICCVFCAPSLVTYSREKLQRSFPELLIGGAAALYGLRKGRRRHRGKRAGALVRLRQRGFRASLPSIHLASVRSLPTRWMSCCSLTQPTRT